MRVLTAGIIPMLLLSACATDRQSRQDQRAAARGALIGAGAGAVFGAITGGDPLAAAAVGAAGGAAIGVITQDGKQRRVYRTESGERYWINDRGERRTLSDDQWNRRDRGGRRDRDRPYDGK